MDSKEELRELLPDGKFPLAVCALSCEHMAFSPMGDLFEAQLWLKAILASMYKLKGHLGCCGGRGPPVQHVQVQLSMGEDIASCAGPEHPEKREVSQLGSI